MARKQVKLKGDDGSPFKIVVDKFGRGVMTLYDDARLPIDAVSEAKNMYLNQDGVWATRPPTSDYGATLTTPIDGAGSFVKYNTNGTTSTYVWVIDNGTFKVSQDGGAWTSKAGVSWTTGEPVTGLQVSGVKSDSTRGNLLLITNGTEELAYYDIDNEVLGSYSSIDSPTNLTATKGGLSSGSYNVYYKVTAVNAIGETLASSEASVSGGIDATRDNWTLGTDYVDLDWDDVSGATRYNIYYSDRSGEQVYLDSVSVSEYQDTGEAVPNPYQETPATDSTGGPKYMDIALSGNRLWGTKDPNLPYRVAWTGTGQYMGAFNPFYGGGYVDLEKGGAERPEKVVHFRTGKGDAVATVLTSDPNGVGSTWAISLSTLTVDTLVIVIPVASKQQGSVGTRSPFGVVEYDDAVYFPSPRGFHNTGSRQSILNVLVTSDISDVIRPTVRNINNAYASGIAGYASDGRIYWSIPLGATSNNVTIVHDLERKGAWALPWTIGAKRFFEYTDSSGNVRLLAIPVSGTKLIEFDGGTLGDSGSAYETNLQSGLIHWDDNHMTWAYIRKAYVELSDPQGQINFKISGLRRGRDFATIGQRSIVANLGVSGLSNDLFGDFQFGDSNGAGEVFTQPSVKKVINVKKLLNNARWTLSSSTVDTRYTLLQVVIEGVLLPATDPSQWKT